MPAFSNLCFKTSFFIALAWALPLVVVTAERSSADVLSTKAKTALLMEASTGTVLYSKAADQPFRPGSLAKVMTAAVIFGALEKGEISEETEFTVSEHAWRTGGAPSRTATMFAALKSSIPVADLLKGLIIHNANDAAIILAEGLAGDEASFSKRMNALAAEIGMTGSHFANPTGFDAPRMTVTARDMTLLASHILARHKNRYGLYSLPDFTWNKIYQRNKNPLLGEIRNLDGLGAGQSEEDGYSGLASVERDGRRIIAVLSGLPSGKARLAATKKLIEGAWEAFSVTVLYKAGEKIADARVFGGVTGIVPLVAASDVAVLLPVGDTRSFRIRAVYDGPLKAPVSEGMTAGEIRVLGAEGIIYRAPLKTGASVDAGTMGERALGAVTEVLFGWF